MKVLQAIIISSFIVGCGAPESTTTQTSLGDGDRDTPDNNPMHDESQCVATVCPAGEQGMPGVDGLDGSSCSVTQSGNDATVSCTDGTTATLEGGEGLVGPQGPAGPAGPAGAAGTTGPQGPQGPAGPTGAKGQDGEDGLLTAGSVCVRKFSQTATWAQVSCDEGDFAIGGGCRTHGAALQANAPVTGEEFSADGDVPDGWLCQSISSVFIEAWVTCVGAP